MPIIQAPAEALGELVARRTARSKTFDFGSVGGGMRKRRLIQKVAPVHFQDDDGQLKDIELDFEVEQGTGDIVASKLPYRVRKHALGIGFDYESRAGGIVRVALVGINGATNFDRTITYDFTRVGHRITFANIRTDLDFVFHLGRSGINIYRVLRSASAPRNFRWAVEYDAAGQSKINTEIRGLDAQKRRLQVSITNSDPQLQASGRMRYFAAESWTGNVRVVDPVTHIASWQDVAEYPVAIDPDITEEIAADGEDGMSYGASWVNNIGSAIYCGDFGGQDMDPGMRWNTVAVPQGATIDLANLKMNVTGKSGAYRGGTLYGDDVDDAAAWASGTRPATRTKTSASVSISAPASTGIKTYNVTAVVQEIVNRAGWVSGNDLALFIINDNASNQWTKFEDFAAAGTDEPTLEIDYTEAAASTSKPFLRRSTRFFRRAG